MPEGRPDKCGLDPICEDDPYPSYPPGEYKVRCYNASYYRDRRFQRWVQILYCHFLTEDGTVCGFLNLGSGDKPSAPRGSQYRRVWVMANGSAPRKRQVLSERVFLGKIFLVQIGTAEKDSKQRQLTEGQKYSKIIDWIACI